MVEWTHEKDVVMSPFVALFVAIFAVLMFIAPLGIWNRLIKINQEQKAHNKYIEEKLKRINELLDVLTSNQDFSEES